MELTLEHLTPYLPYNVRVKHKHGGEARINGIFFNGLFPKGGIRVGDIKKWPDKKAISDWPVPDVKPILRPLSEFNEIGWYDEDENEIHLTQYTDDNLFFHNILDSDDVPIQAVLHLMGQLFEKHYDVFGLIEAGLAVKKED